jgi:hypothetical protein
VPEHFAEEEQKTFGRILSPSPLRSIEQLGRRGLQVDQILQVPTAIAIDGGVQLQEDLIPPAEVADLESGSVCLQGEALLQAVWQAAAKQRFVGDLVVEPISGEIEVSADIVGRSAKPVGQRARRNQDVRFHQSENVDILRRRAIDQSQGQQGRAAADNVMSRRMIARGEKLPE